MNTPYVFKKCGKCGEWLVASKVNFHKNKDGKYGLKSICKKCMAEYRKQWCEENKDKRKQYYEENKGKILEQGNHSELLQKDGYYAKLYNAYYNSLN